MSPFEPYRRTVEERFSRPDGLPCDGCDRTCTRRNLGYYMVKYDVWVWQANLPEEGCMMCTGCLEIRLGRALVFEDFPDFPVNEFVRVAYACR